MKNTKISVGSATPHQNLAEMGIRGLTGVTIDDLSGAVNRTGGRLSALVGRGGTGPEGVVVGTHAALGPKTAPHLGQSTSPSSKGQEQLGQ